ncbi:MAG: hypothetical protein QNK35_02890 [Bacteroides sp.]|nr:hypothetical protein [Bacteroides sp.]
MIRNYFSLALFLFLANNALNAQMDSAQRLLFNQIYSAAEKEYGIHQELINGPLFENKNQDVSGHPYLLNYYSNTGSVIYRGKQYSNLNLRYDINDQQLLLIYLFDSLEYKLHLQKEFISEFTIENRKFINETFSASEDAEFYQVFGEDFPIRVLYFWKKDLSNLYANNPDIKVFSSANKESFILLNGELYSYKGNRTFANRFSSKPKTAIKEYFRKNKIKVLLVSDNEMELLIEFINSLAK